MTSSHDPSHAGRLVVFVPHWSATVTVIDNDLRLVADVGKVAPLDKDSPVGRIEIEVAPGAYEVELTLDGKTEAHWVLVEPGRDTVVERAQWTLAIESSMPLPDAVPTVGETGALAQAAADASRAQGDAPGVASEVDRTTRLILFARALGRDDPNARAFDFDFQLHNEDDVLVDLSISEPVTEPGRHWQYACDLPPGHYVMRAPAGPASDKGKKSYRYQPIFLPAGWETHAFLRCDGPAMLSTLSIDLVPLGTGFDPQADHAVAADALLTALAGGHADQALLGSDRMEQLLRDEHRNPWLSVLAAYALLSAPLTQEGDALLKDLLSYLAITLPDHPDVQALLLSESASVPPFRHPPMLYAALRRVREHAVRHQGIIAVDGSLAKLCDSFFIDSAWTAWTDEPMASGFASSATKESDDEMPAPVPSLVEAFPANAPVYPLTPYGAGSGDAAGPPPSLATHAAIIDAAGASLNVAGASPPEVIEVPIGSAVPDLLNVSAEQVSQSTGLSLDLVQTGFADLETFAPEDAATHPSAKTDSTQGALVAAIRTKQAQLLSTIVENPSEADAAALQTAPIEDQVARLKAEAARLREIDDASPSRAAQLDELAEQLDEASAQLLRHAHIAIIADEKGNLRYGNRVLRDRLIARGEQREDVMSRLQNILGDQKTSVARVAAADLSPTSPEGMAGATVEVCRTKIQGPDQSFQGAIYYLRDAAVQGFSFDQERQVESILSQITLHASLAQYADDTQRAEPINALSAQIGALTGLLRGESRI